MGRYRSVSGETIKIVIEDYVQHLSSYNFQLLFKPDLLFGEDFQYQNRIAVEFNHLYHWHPLMPDRFNVSGKTYQMDEFVYHSGLVVEHGTRSFTDSLSRQIAGQVSFRTHIESGKSNLGDPSSNATCADIRRAQSVGSRRKS